MCVFAQVHAVPKEARRGCQDPLELELQAFVNCPTGTPGTKSKSLQESPAFAGYFLNRMECIHLRQRLEYDNLEPLEFSLKTGTAQHRQANAVTEAK